MCITKFTQKPEIKEKHPPPHGTAQKKNILIFSQAGIKIRNQDRVFHVVGAGDSGLITMRGGINTGAPGILDTGAADQ